MKSFFASLAWIALWAAFSLLASSCTMVHHPTAGTFASIGGDTKGMQFTQDGFSMAENNNSTAFKEAKKAVAAYFLIRGAVDMFNTAAGVTNTSTAADVSKSQISADKAVQLETIKAESAAAELAVP